MNLIAEITMPPSGRLAEQTMHLFDAEATKENALCGADASACDLTAVQFCLRQLVNRIPVGNVCGTCVGCAARWAEGHCRRLEADATSLRARAQRLYDRDATRYRNSVAEANLEADHLLSEARELRRLPSVHSR